MCWRGVLTKLAATPYDNGPRAEGWKIAVTKYRGTHYICEVDTAMRKQNVKNQTEKQRLMSYWGHKFEKYVTKGSFHVSQPPAAVSQLMVSISIRSAYILRHQPVWTLGQVGQYKRRILLNCSNSTQEAFFGYFDISSHMYRIYLQLNYFRVQFTAARWIVSGSVCMEKSM